jgi:hypothetical protein
LFQKGVKNRLLNLCREVESPIEAPAITLVFLKRKNQGFEYLNDVALMQKGASRSITKS